MTNLFPSESIKKSLIILIVMLIVNTSLGSLYLGIIDPNFSGNLSDVASWSISTFIYCLAIYLINRNNIIGDAIVFYQSFQSVHIDYELGGYYGIENFIHSPQAMLADILYQFQV